MKKIFLLIFILCLNHITNAQAWVWEKVINTSVNSIGTDPNANIIVLSAANSTTTQLAKYTKDGLLLWSKQLTKLGAYTPSGSVVVDKSGNIYTFTDGFDSVNNIFTGIKPTGVTKFGPNGNIIWHKYYSAISGKLAATIDNNNNIYVGFSGFSVDVTLGNQTIQTTGDNYYISIGSLAPDGTTRWLKMFPFSRIVTNGSAFATGISLSGNKLFLAGYSKKGSILFDNGVTLYNDRCTAWLGAFNCDNGQCNWGKTHTLFYYCAGITCICRNPYISTNNFSDKIALTNTLNGAFTFKPNDTIASITASGQTAIASYYTIYDTLGMPIKGKIIAGNAEEEEIVMGSRNNFFFIKSKDSLKKVDTGYNLIWKVTLPQNVQRIYIPQNVTNDILLTYTRSGATYLAKISDSAAIISGKTYVDFNNDGIFTNADSALSNTLLTTNFPLVNGISSNDSGKYFILASPNNYTITANFNHPYYQFLPATHSAIITQFSEVVSGKDFRLRPLFNFTDVSLNFSPLNIARPGQIAYYTVSVKNYGTSSVASVEIGIKLPPLASYTGISGGAVVLNAPDSITINLGNINPFETKKAILSLYIATTATIHDTLKYYPKAYPYTNDTIKSSNLDTLIQNIRTSFDPNEKGVNRSAQPIEDLSKSLTYTIQFQNTGNDTAFYVRLSDTLSSKLDVTTFEFIDASHPLQTEIKNNILNFIFNPIALVDSITNEPLSHGFVKFKIKPLSSTLITDTIFNNAAIYFDYNLPVITNKAKSWYFATGTLAVILKSFIASKKNTSVLLKFETASETDLYKFVIEKSIDGINFYSIGTLNAKGNASMGSSYIFEDITPISPITFYRLKMVDNFLKTTYSWIVFINNSTLNVPQVSISPNPVNKILFLSFKHFDNFKIYKCKIVDTNGKIVWLADINTTLRDTYSVNTTNFASGSYFITVFNNAVFYNKKIIISH